MTDNNDLLAEMDRAIETAENLIKQEPYSNFKPIILLLKYLKGRIEAAQQKQYERGMRAGALLRGNVADHIDKTIAEIRKEEYEKGCKETQERIKRAIVVHFIEAGKIDASPSLQFILQTIEGKIC